MATLAESLVSSSARKLPVRVRGDLSARRQRYLGRSYWVVKDPVGLKYYRFQDEEYAILCMLDGTKSLDEIKDAFEAEFPPQKITLEELQQFLGMLHSSGLILAGVAGQGYELKKRRDERKRQELLAKMSNILCIQFKGIDPERILNWLYPKVRFLFHPIVVWLCVAMVVAAAGSILVNFDAFRGNLPEFRQFFTIKNAFLLAACLGVTKVIHEFGHGLTCKHYGGECHEMGVMILVLTPCLYCNVSDSWMLPNKWHRAMIGLAGIYVEVVLASICTFIWWNTQDGLIHYLALNVMFLSSVSTILFNANPLLRYDGYYVLADVLEIPNLRQKASQILTRKAGHWFLGLEPPDDPFLPERNQLLFAVYSVAAVMYRWVVLFGILFFLYKVFEPIGLKILGQAIAAMSLYGILVMPMWKLYKFLSVPGRLHQVKKVRMFATLAAIAALIGFIFFVPLPYRVFAPLEIGLQDGIPIVVTAPGELVEIKKFPGDEVRPGDAIAVLENLDLQRELIQLEGERAKYQSQLESLRLQVHEDPSAGAQIPAIAETLKKVQQQIAEKQWDLGRLTLRVPSSAASEHERMWIVPALYREKKEDPDVQLASWSGTPLAERNIGAYLEPGTAVCQIGNLEKLEAVVIINQSSINFVKPGQKVEIVLDALPFDTFHGRLEMKGGADPIKDLSLRLAGPGGGPVPTKSDPLTGAQVPLSTSYRVRVPLENTGKLLKNGMIGTAKIHATPQTIARRAWRLINETFAFKL